VNKPKIFTLFEHTQLKIGDCNERKEIFTISDFNLIEKALSNKQIDSKQLSLGHNSIFTCQFVGVLALNHLTIEVLPKADKVEDKSIWRSKLIDILRRTTTVNVINMSSAHLQLKCNSILEYYIEIFLQEAEYIFKNGLVKKYVLKETNQTSLKGRIIFSKHFSKNINHKELFYVEYSSYDHNHLLNRLLYETLILINSITNNSFLKNRASSLLLQFPEASRIKASEKTFQKIRYNKKNSHYENAITISKLLLLNFHPDINRGDNKVIALMFDMNKLWEKFVFVTLSRNLKGYRVKEKPPKSYWQIVGRRAVNLEPDIVITNNENNYIIDTKWKMLGDNINPNAGDIQQMYAYTKYFSSSHTLLLFPGTRNEHKLGYFFDEESRKLKYRCSVGIIYLDSNVSITQWQLDICKFIKQIIS
jgi:5-methylcytosine-specific restriction enzyme subunit McrC